MAVQPEAKGSNLVGATHHDGGPKIVPVLTPGKRKRIAYEITTVEEVRESAPVSRPGRTVMDSVTERLLSQAPGGVRVNADRTISGEAVAEMLAGLSVPSFHIKDLHPSIDGNKPFEHHVETVFNSSVNGFVRVARILERHLVNNADRMPDAHAHTLQLREIITQLAGVADGTIQTTPPELARFKINVEVFDQNVLARQRAGAYVDPIELQMYAAAEKSFSAIRQQEALCAVAKIPGFDGLESEHKDAAWKFSILEGGMTTQAEQYVAEVMRSHNAALPLERVVAGTIVQLWEGFGTTMMALHELPSQVELPPSVATMVREGTASMEQTLQNLSGSRSLEESVQQLRERADEIRQRQTQDPSLSPIATEVLAGIETFLGGLQQYQRVEAIISRPNAGLLTQKNLENMLILEQFAQEHPQEIGALRGYAYAIDAGGVFAYMIQPVKGYPTEAAYLLDHIQRELTTQAALNPDTWEARRIAQTPTPVAPQFLDGTWVNLYPAPEGYAEAYRTAIELSGRAEQHRREIRSIQQHAQASLAELTPEQRQRLEDRARTLLSSSDPSSDGEILRLAQQAGWKLPYTRETSESGREYLVVGETTQRELGDQARVYLGYVYEMTPQKVVLAPERVANEVVQETAVAAGRFTPNEPETPSGDQMPADPYADLRAAAATVPGDPQASERSGRYWSRLERGPLRIVQRASDVYFAIDRLLDTVWDGVKNNVGVRAKVFWQHLQHDIFTSY